jgi:hypothetical protein
MLFLELVILALQRRSYVAAWHYPLSTRCLCLDIGVQLLARGQTESPITLKGSSLQVQHIRQSIHVSPQSLAGRRDLVVVVVPI